jgi:hypothetical protein
VFLNGRLYLAKSNTGDIYCSNLNDPAVWTAGDFISTEVYPDDIQAIVKIDNYILAIGSQSCEYFYDAANATGSPLARNEGMMLPFGCIVRNSIAVNKNTVMFMANPNDGQAVFKIIEGSKARDVDSSSIVPAYNQMINNPDPLYQFSENRTRGMFFRHGGDLYYGFMFNSENNSDDRRANVNMYYAYSFNTNMWTELQLGDSLDRSERDIFPVVCTSQGSTGNITTHIGGNLTSSTGNNSAFFGALDEYSGMDQMSDFGTDTAIYQEVRTPNLDFGTMNRKAMHRLSVDVECADSPTTLVSFSVSWNDSDYAYLQWSTPRTLSSRTNNNLDWFPFITQLGTFRRRAIRVVSVAGKVMRWKAMEIDINKGQQ